MLRAILTAGLFMLPVVTAGGASSEPVLKVQYSGNVVLCRLPPKTAERYNNGDRDCRTPQVRGGQCLCPTHAGPMVGTVIGPSGGWNGGGYGGGWGGGGWGGGGGGGPLLRCRVSPQASQYRGGNRDCNVRRTGSGNACSCPSSVGPLPGRIVGAWD